MSIIDLLRYKSRAVIWSFCFKSVATVRTYQSLSAVIPIATIIVIVSMSASCFQSHKDSSELTTNSSASRPNSKDDTDNIRDGGGALPRGNDSNKTQDFSVSVAMSAATVCPGECVTLKAQASGGTEPYHYSWSPKIGDGSGPHVVCPTKTRTYEVTVTDNMVTATEFATDPVTAVVDIVFEENCSHEDVAVDRTGNIDGSTSEGSTAPDAKIANTRQFEEFCRAQAALTPNRDVSRDPNVFANYFGRYRYPSMLTTDTQNNIIISIGFDGILDVGGEIHDGNGGPENLLVSKYDSSCKRLWSRSYGAPSAWIEGASITASGSDLVLAGSFAGVVDFGAGPIGSTNPLNAVLFKLDEDGNTLWSKYFVASPQYAFFWDVAVDNQGEIITSGIFNGSGTLGGETLGVDDITVDTFFIAKFSSDGEHIWSKEVPDAEAYPHIAVINHELIAISYQSSDKIIVATWNSDGDEIWKQTINTNDHGPDYYVLGFDANASGIIGLGDWPARDVPNVVLHRIDVNTYLDSTTTIIRQNQDFFSYITAVDRSGYTFEVGMFVNSLEDIGLQSLGDDDVFLLQHDQDGTGVGYARYGTSYDDWPLGLTVDSENHPVLAAITDKDVGVEDLTIIRYAP
jgi:hypothetical protein